MCHYYKKLNETQNKLGWTTDNSNSATAKVSSHDILEYIFLTFLHIQHFLGDSPSREIR